jgi:NhaA family Na+:H+ antiporter
MSLFIGSLTFEDPGYAVGVRLGVFLGSILCGVCGYLVLRAVGGRQTARDIGGRPSGPFAASG